MLNIVIAIDGPAGAGKSTVAKMLAAKLGLRYLDTGAMYRAVALAAQRAGLSPDDGELAAALANGLTIEFAEPDEAGGAQRVLINGEDITDAVRDPAISELASALSAHSPVRRILATRQQELISRGGVTLEGRDTTTVVAPNADVKVFLTASLEERARRRHQELSERGDPISIEELTRQMMERDHRDYMRDDSPLKIAEGAIVVESFGIPPEIVVQKILDSIPSDLLE